MKIEAATVHGFSSSGWAGNVSNFPREVVKTALAHVIGDKAEQAYRRGDALEKHPKRDKRLDAPHFRLYDLHLASPAYLSLGCPVRALLIEITRLYKGNNNGRLGLSVRRASERCNIARGTAQRAFSELQERGFIELATKGAFSLKSRHASEWRLTWWTCDVTGELPSKKFMSWGREKQKPVSKYPVTVSNQSQRT